MKYLIIVLSFFALCGCTSTAQTESAEKSFQDYCLFHSQDRAVTERAFNSLKNSADSGNIDAQLILASLYQTGRGYCPKDINQSIEYWKKAIAQGNLSAITGLADLYLKGQAGIAEKSNGLDLLEMYKNKFSTVECTLGKIYYYGEFGVESNTAKGLQLIKDSAARGNLYALYILGGINFKGKNYPEAFSCYKKAADKGYPPALSKLAICYSKGLGCEKSSSTEKEIDAKYKKALPCEITNDGTEVIVIANSGTWGIAEDVDYYQFLTLEPIVGENSEP